MPRCGEGPPALVSIGKARAEAAEVLRIMPNWTIERVAVPLTTFRRTQDAEHVFDGLRQAGVPDLGSPFSVSDQPARQFRSNSEERAAPLECPVASHEQTSGIRVPYVRDVPILLQNSLCCLIRGTTDRIPYH